MAELASLLAELEAAHVEFLQALSEVDADLVTTPGVMDDWSVRDLVVHVAAWSEHGASALELAGTGRGSEFAYSKADTDALNAGFLSGGRQLTPAAALRREEEAFAAFRGLLAGLEPSLLGLVLGNGDTVEAVVRYDGPDHYAEHTAHLLAWFGTEDEVEVDEPADA